MSKRPAGRATAAYISLKTKRHTFERKSHERKAMAHLRHAAVFYLLPLLFLASCTSLKDPSLSGPMGLQSVEAVKIRAIVTLGSSGHKGRATIEILPPNSIRMEIYGALMRPVVILVAKGSVCEIYSKGEISECNGGGVGSFEFSPAELIDVLTGRLRKASYTGFDGSRVLVTAKDGGGSGMVPKKVMISAPDEVVTIEVREVEYLSQIDEDKFVLR